MALKKHIKYGNKSSIQRGEQFLVEFERIVGQGRSGDGAGGRGLGQTVEQAGLAAEKTREFAHRSDPCGAPIRPAVATPNHLAICPETNLDCGGKRMVNGRLDGAKDCFLSDGWASSSGQRRRLFIRSSPRKRGPST